MNLFFHPCRLRFKEGSRIYPDGPGIHGPVDEGSRIYPDGPGIHGPVDEGSRIYPDGPGIHNLFSKVEGRFEG
jgi:hypothetical protein